jgi:hypothetical protein
MAQNFPVVCVLSQLGKYSVRITGFCTCSTVPLFQCSDAFDSNRSPHVTTLDRTAIDELQGHHYMAGQVQLPNILGSSPSLGRGLKGSPL